MLYFPRGTYRVTRTIELPRFTTLRGEGTELVVLNWPDRQDPLPALVRGTNSFAVEQITLYAANHVDVIVGDTGRPAGGGQRGAARGAGAGEHVPPRFGLERILGGSLEGGRRQALRGGPYGAGRTLCGSAERTSRSPTAISTGAAVRSSSAACAAGWWRATPSPTGAGAGICIGGSDGLIFEDNVVQGGDLMSTGGGLELPRRLDLLAERLLRTQHPPRLLGSGPRGDDHRRAHGAFLGPITSVDGPTLTLPQRAELDGLGQEEG